MTPKEKLESKLQDIEKQAEGPKLPAPVPSVEGIFTKSSRRIGKGIEKVQKEREEAEKILKIIPEAIEANFRELQNIKLLCQLLKGQKEINWENEFLKDFFHTTEESLKSLVSTKRDGKVKLELKTGTGNGNVSIEGTEGDIFHYVANFKEDILSGGKLSEEAYNENLKTLQKIEERNRKILQKKSFDISKKTGRKDERQLSLPLLPEVLKITKKEQGFLQSGEDERLKTYIAQKVGLLRGKDTESLKKISEVQILTIDEIKKVCKNGKRTIGNKKAYELLQTFSKVNFSAPVLVGSKDKGEEGQLIHYLKLGLKKDGTERDYLKPKLSLDALEYLQEHGQKSFLPPIDSPEVSSLNNFSFKLLKALGNIQHQIEGHFSKNIPEEFWLQVNIEVLYKDFLEEETSSTNGHNNRLKDKFLTALTELTENKLFLKAPFLTLPYNTKKGTLDRRPRISDLPDLMTGQIKTPLNGMKKAGTTWEDILKGSLLFCLSFRSMAEFDRERVRKGIEEKRKRKYSKLQALKKTSTKPQPKAPEAPKGLQGAGKNLQDEELNFPEVEGDPLK